MQFSHHIKNYFSINCWFKNSFLLLNLYNISSIINVFLHIVYWYEVLYLLFYNLYIEENKAVYI